MEKEGILQKVLNMRMKEDEIRMVTTLRLGKKKEEPQSKLWQRTYLKRR
jgi:hypothetical protein